MKSLWNDRYAREEYIYGDQPNAFFKSEINKLKPGSLLLPGEGEGRNAVWAAKHGWQVVAVDYSEAGRHKAMQLASRTNTTIMEYLLADLADYQPEPESFDAIALIFVHLEPQLRQKVHRRLVDALRPGGTLILEAFNPGQISYDSGGPKSIDMMYTPEMLRKDFAQMKFIRLENCFALINEGNYHNGTAALVRMVARKQAVTV